MLGTIFLPKFLRIDPRKQQIVDAIATLQSYGPSTKKMIGKRRKLFSRMPIDHRKRAIQAGYMDRLDAIEKLYNENSKLMNSIAHSACKRHNISSIDIRGAKNLGSPFEILELFVRDWSGHPGVVDYLLSSLRTHVPIASQDKIPTILVPGAGLGRAAQEISHMGYETEALDFSYLMVLVSEFLVDSTSSFSIFPYVHQFSHQVSESLQLRSLQIPDVQPKLPVQFGNFLEWNQQSDYKYDAIVTLFFMDTAENVFSYIDTIQSLLKQNGVWINLGPLKWGTAPQAELTLDELHDVIRASGFDIQDKYRSSNEYFPDGESLWKGIYGTAGWVAVKKN